MIAAPVNPVQALAPSTGLIASAAPIRDQGARWELGLAWRPEYCITHQGFGPCADVVGTPPDGDIGVVYYFPPGYRVRDYCTTLGGLLDTERLQRQADAIASATTARELWTGALSIADPQTVAGGPYVNPHLASADAVTVMGTGSLDERLGQLEEAARVVANGQTVYLHVPIHMITPVAHKLRRVGKVLYTALDSVVVADAGYPGTGPAGTGTSWAYATGPVQVRLSTVEIEDTPSETLNRRDNRQEIWGSRVFAATFDPCVHLAMDMAEPPPA